MKKIIKRILLGLLAVVVIAITAGCFYLFHDPAKPQVVAKPTVTDVAGNAYLAVEDNGTTYAAVTDEQGKVYAAQIKDDGSIGETIGEISDQIDKNDLPTKNDGPTVNITVDPNAYQGEVVSGSNVSGTTSAVNKGTTNQSGNTTNATPGTTGSSGNQSGTTANNQSGTTTKNNQSGTTAPTESQGTTSANGLTAYRIKKYQQIFNSGTYLMEFTTNDADLGDTPITMAIKNKNVLVTTQIENIACQLLYLSDSDTTYILFDNYKKYCKLPDSMKEEGMDMGKMVSSFGTSEVDENKIKVENVNINGQSLILESYTAKDGTVNNYYFKGDDLVRRDNIAKDGTVDSTYITKFTSDVPDSTFDIPKGYGYINLSWLEAFAGSSKK